MARAPGLPEDLRVAAPERAVLELLYEAGVKQSLEEARNLFVRDMPLNCRHCAGSS